MTIISIYRNGLMKVSVLEPARISRFLSLSAYHGVLAVFGAAYTIVLIIDDEALA